MTDDPRKSDNSTSRVQLVVANKEALHQLHYQIRALPGTSVLASQL